MKNFIGYLSLYVKATDKDGELCTLRNEIEFEGDVTQESIKQILFNMREDLKEYLDCDKTSLELELITKEEYEGRN